jgi:hypothetical protein
MSAAVGLAAGALGMYFSSLIQLLEYLLVSAFVALIFLAVLFFVLPDLAYFLFKVLGVVIAIPIVLLLLPIVLPILLLSKHLEWWRIRDLFSRRAPTVRRGASSHFNADRRAKVSYYSERAARREADLFWLDRGERMNAYKCERGGHWHIGHAR